MKDTALLVKAILYRKLSNSLWYFCRTLSHEKLFHISTPTFRIETVTESEDGIENSSSRGLCSGSADPHLAGDVDRLDGAGGPRQDAGNRSLNTHRAPF